MRPKTRQQSAVVLQLTLQGLGLIEQIEKNLQEAENKIEQLKLAAGSSAEG